MSHACANAANLLIAKDTSMPHLHRRPLPNNTRALGGGFCCATASDAARASSETTVGSGRSKQSKQSQYTILCRVAWRGILINNAPAIDIIMRQPVALMRDLVHVQCDVLGEEKCCFTHGIFHRFHIHTCLSWGGPGQGHVADRPGVRTGQELILSATCAPRTAAA